MRKTARSQYLTPNIQYLASFVFSFVLLVVFSGRFASKINAQTFSLNPSSATKTVGAEFTVDLNIDTAGKAVAGADVKMTFDADILEVVKVEKGDFFSEGTGVIGNGTLYIPGYFGANEPFATKTGSGKVATLTLKGKKSGSSTLAFVCTAQTNDTNIVDANAADIVNCSGTRNGTYTFSGSGESAASATTTTATPTPKIPVSGVTLPTFATFGAGVLLTIFGLAIIF